VPLKFTDDDVDLRFADVREWTGFVQISHTSTVVPRSSCFSPLVICIPVPAARVRRMGAVISFCHFVCRGFSGSIWDAQYR